MFFDDRYVNCHSTEILSAPMSQDCFYEDRCFTCIMHQFQPNPRAAVGDSIQLAFRRGANTHPDLDLYVSDLQKVMSCASHRLLTNIHETLSAIIHSNASALTREDVIRDIRQLTRWVPYRTDLSEVQIIFSIQGNVFTQI